MLINRDHFQLVHNFTISTYEKNEECDESNLALAVAQLIYKRLFDT